MSLRLVMLVVVAMSVVCLAAVAVASEAKSQEIELISPEKVKAMLGSADLLIVDVRKAEDWENSTGKIKSAVREDPGQLNEWLTSIQETRQ